MQVFKTQYCKHYFRRVTPSNNDANQNEDNHELPQIHNPLLSIDVSEITHQTTSLNSIISVEESSVFPSFNGISELSNIDIVRDIDEDDESRNDEDDDYHPANEQDNYQPVKRFFHN